MIVAKAKRSLSKVMIYIHGPEKTDSYRTSCGSGERSGGNWSIRNLEKHNR